MARKKILFVIYSIYGAGAEKQMQYLLRYFSRNTFELHLLVFCLTGDEKKVVPPDVRIHHLSTIVRPSSIFLTFKLFRLLKELAPHVLISFTWGVNLISLAAGLLAKIPVIVSERVYTPKDIKNYSFSRLRAAALSLLYKRASMITAVTQSVKDGLMRHYHLPEQKIVVIHNGIALEEIPDKVQAYSVTSDNYVLACGSLVERKNFALLLEAMSGIPGHRLIILGEGPQRRMLESKARELHVDVSLPGYKENPFPYFGKANVFVLTSKNEGFPNVILEALSCGVPVVAVDCPGGIEEIIQNGREGIIVAENDPEALAEAIRKILRDKFFAETLRTNARYRVKAFGIKEVIHRYTEIVEAVIKREG